MNKDYILYNLREAIDGILSTIKEIENDPEYEYGNYVVDMRHIYHHVNTAWNARDADKKRTDECSQKDFDMWRQFPKDMEMI